ncbi:MAG TPA: type II secretion system protein N [Burkholderiaceae bacterium]|nr:type II secretion system protein N [Burkholderiaceae bacterium]
MRTAGWIATVALGVVVGIATGVTFAPASFADRAVARISDGRLRLADTSGTVWRGAGRLVLSDPQDSAPRTTLAGVVIPGAIRWQLSPRALLVGLLDARVEHESMRRPVLLTGRPGELRLSPASVALPPVQLDRLGSPWNTIRPTGALSVSWDNVLLRAGRFEGKALIELQQVASALTPVRPLGAYQIEVIGAGNQTQLRMITLNGPLRLQGSGTWTARSGLQFVAEAQADQAEELRLQPLLGLLGRRDGERTIIRIGA